LELLNSHGVKAVFDVRSQPYSRYAPQSNRSNIERALKDHDIDYYFMGAELGARPDNPEVFNDGTVDFRLLGKTKGYVNGIERVLDLANDLSVAIACTEKDPTTCHRGILIFRLLEVHVDGDSLKHILGSGGLETQTEMTTRLMTDSGLPDTKNQMSLFDDNEDLVARSYSIAESKIAWKDPSYVERTGEYLEH
jgi:uncharacterized protein (DUF488 family)